jgi:glycerol-3-phosphate O-acyltransferase / dihydroxyacetone phosphate acyltransferase
MMLWLIWASLLLFLSLGGLALWFPVAATTLYGVRNVKKTGTARDTWEQIAQFKLIYGCIAFLAVYAGAVAFTLRIFPLTPVAVPMLMWMSLRWFEDAVSAARAFVALGRFLRLETATLARLRATRADLHHRVMQLAVDGIGLPADPENQFVAYEGKDKDRVVGRLSEKCQLAFQHLWQLMDF